MGVPAFFRWLSRKYPSVIIECVEKKQTDDAGQNIYEDASLPNPNGIEFDNLYLDMNGIIHPCTHPEDKPAPKNEDEMMVAIFECIDRLFNIVRPRKLLYMAIDGVAPRAKMNQQRSRRFRAAKESVEKQLTIKKIREELTARGVPLPPEKPKEEHFDSNCITPGTPFMERLSICLHYYIYDRLNNYPGWRDVKVILSDANVPGEGEHKLMDYIRRQRAQSDHDPNTQHVLCGADADLIMLGLATHEPNFTIIREEFLPNKPKPCDICGGMGHEMAKCDGIGEPTADVQIAKEVQFIFVRLSVLKEYLREELQMPNLPFKYDFERVIDDWVFMCFFVGNDFLPHLPSLEIREGAIDRLVTLYKKCVYKTGGYLTDSGDVNLDRVQMILYDLGLMEDEIFKNRKKTEEMFKARDKAKKRREENQKRPNFKRFEGTQFEPVALGRAGNRPEPLVNVRQQAAHFRTMSSGSQSMSSAESNLAQNQNKRAGLESMLKQPGEKRTASEAKLDTDKAEEEEETPDEVRLWEDGFKDRYYESKFDVMPDNLEFRYAVALHYVRGLCWVLKYYYQGCASWKWYFPYHYAPFASDFVNITGLSTQFEKKTIPFKPLQQLMAVFPAASGSHVPAPWRDLMSNPKSPIIDFYPEDFTIDLNGKKFAWQGVALLPFVDESRLFKALKPYYRFLSEGENKRNTLGSNKLYVSPSNPGFSFIRGLYQNNVDDSEEVQISIQGMQGTVLLDADCVPMEGILESPVQGLHSICENKVYSVKYADPVYDDNFIFPARRLPKAIDPPHVLKDKGNTSSNYRPMIGFTQSNQRATLGAAGHRMINHQYSAIPPPSNNRSYGSNSNNMGNRNFNQGGREDNSYVQHSGGGGNYRGNNYNTQGNNSNNWRNNDYRNNRLSGGNNSNWNNNSNNNSRGGDNTNWRTQGGNNSQGSGQNRNQGNWRNQQGNNRSGGSGNSGQGGGGSGGGYWR